MNRFPRKFRVSKNLLAPALASAAAAVLVCPLFFSPRNARAAAQDAAPAFSSEKGRFRIRVNGQDAGTEQFDISKSGDHWIDRGSAEIREAQGTTRVTGTLLLRPDGTPIRYDWSSQGAKKASASVVFQGTKATSALTIAGAKTPYTQQFTFASPRVAILDNNLYDQYILLSRLYDQKAGGAQTFSVLVPQELTPGTLTVESLGKQDVNGKKLSELRVQTPDNEIDLYLEGSELVRIVAPSANAEITRE